MSSLNPVSGDAQEILELLTLWQHEERPKPLVIETSGSTGEPKGVVLSRSAMRASAKATYDRLGGPGQWVLNLPPTYVGGVQVLFRSAFAGTVPIIQFGDLADAAAALTGSRRYLSIVPTQLRRNLRSPRDTEALGTFDTVLVGGGPLWPEVRAEAAAAGVNVVQTYGMAETCGGCVYDGVPLDGVAVKIDSEGQVLLSGPMLFDGYKDEPERTAMTLQEGWLRTNDLGGFDEDGLLRLRGRVDSVVNSGGVKVPAEAVEAMLEAHPSIYAAVVVGVPDDEWGERVVAVVESEPEVSLADLRNAVHPRAWAPRQMVRQGRLPSLSNGKVDRVAVRELARNA